MKIGSILCVSVKITKTIYTYTEIDLHNESLLGSLESLNVRHSFYFLVDAEQTNSHQTKHRNMNGEKNPHTHTHTQNTRWKK